MGPKFLWYFFHKIYMKHLQNFIYVNKAQALDFCSINTKFWAACFVLMQLANLTQLHPWAITTFGGKKFGTQLLTFSVTPKN